ncbi:hypothetical protein EV368DRAFT_66927 [Lentinula lateritia]|nr:hypothetical protein EV368DRAFT_66927 [Lentinula lateritia]
MRKIYKCRPGSSLVSGYKYKYKTFRQMGAAARIQGKHFTITPPTSSSSSGLSQSLRKNGTSVARKPKDPDSIPRTIVYPASMLHRMIEELRSSLTSASALRQQELLQATATERTQMEARLMGSLRDDIRAITRSELKLLESNLQRKLTSLLPMEAVNRLLSSFAHLYDPVPPTQGPPRYQHNCQASRTD